MKKYEYINLSTALTATLSDLDLAIEYAKASGDETLGKFLSYSVMDLWLGTHSCDDKDQRTVLYLEQGVDDFYDIAEDLSESFYEPFDKLEYNYPQSKAKRAQRHHNKYKDTKKRGRKHHSEKKDLFFTTGKKQILKEKVVVKESLAETQFEGYDYQTECYNLLNDLERTYYSLQAKENQLFEDLFRGLCQDYLYGYSMEDVSYTLWKAKNYALDKRMIDYAEQIWHDVNWEIFPWMGLVEQIDMIYEQVIDPLMNFVNELANNLTYKWRYETKPQLKAQIG